MPSIPVPRWFAAGWYDNSVMVQSNISSTIKVGIKSTSNTASAYWSIFTNFRLYYYGSLTKDDVITSIDEITNQYDSTISSTYYDLQSRAIKNPSRGIYIRNGKKILVK